MRGVFATGHGMWLVPRAVWGCGLAGAYGATYRARSMAASAILLAARAVSLM